MKIYGAAGVFRWLQRCTNVSIICYYQILICFYLSRTIGNIDNIDNDLPSILDCSSSSVNDFLLTDESSSQANEPRRKYTKKHADAEITTVFKQVMQECANSIREIAKLILIRRNLFFGIFSNFWPESPGYNLKAFENSGGHKRFAFKKIDAKI